MTWCARGGGCDHDQQVCVSECHVSAGGIQKGGPVSDQECQTPSCGYPHAEGTFICKICVQQLSRDLGDIPALIDDLNTTMTRQDKLGSSGGRRGGETALPWKEPAAEALWVLVQTVMTWVREMQDPDAAPFPDAPIAAARWLLVHVREVTVHKDAGQVVDEIAAAVARAYEVIDRPPDLLLAGQCGADGCEEYLYAGVSARTTTCRACGAEHSVAERRAWMMQYASELNLTPVMALAWVALLMGKSIPRGTWDSWTARGRIEANAHDHTGAALYRFGDVRDLAADWVARPRKETAA